jgi:O-methyltransferase involved in polyketide biosynthesis
MALSKSLHRSPIVKKRIYLKWGSENNMKEFEKISPTAKLVAYARTFTDIPFAKEIAIKSNAKQSFEEQTGEIRASPVWEARYKVTDKIIKEHGITQVLEVAAGLSPRGLSMTKKPDVIYVATDLPQILEEEKEITLSILAELHESRPNLHFQAVNALDMESLSKAVTFFKSDKPLAILTEGLLPYFTMDEKRTLAKNIHKIFSEYSGCWIANEVWSKDTLKKMSQSAGDVAKKRVEKDQYNIISGDNIFSDDDEIKRFFEHEWFKIEKFSHLQIFGQLTSVKSLGLSEEEIVKIKQMLSIRDTLILTPSHLHS